MPISAGRTFPSLRIPWTTKDESWRGGRSGRRDLLRHKQRQREIKRKVCSENLLCRSSRAMCTDLLEDGMQVRFVESAPEPAEAIAEASLDRSLGFTRPGKHNIGWRERRRGEIFVAGEPDHLRGRPYIPGNPGPPDPPIIFPMTQPIVGPVALPRIWQQCRVNVDRRDRLCRIHHRITRTASGSHHPHKEKKRYDRMT
jgi:hypothetical protein